MHFICSWSQEKETQSMYIQTTTTNYLAKHKCAQGQSNRYTDNIYVAKLVKQLAKHMSGPALDFLLSQLRFSNGINNGRRCSVQDKSFAMSILHSSPQT